MLILINFDVLAIQHGLYAINFKTQQIIISKMFHKLNIIKAKINHTIFMNIKQLLHF